MRSQRKWGFEEVWGQSTRPGREVRGSGKEAEEEGQ